MSFSRNFLGLLGVCFLFLSCSPGEKNTRTCIPNHEQDGVGILLNSNQDPVEEFTLEVCYVDKAFSTSATLYGLFGESNLSTINMAAQYDLEHFDLIEGAVYTFRFEGDEDYFGIFLDDSNGNFATNVEILRGDIYR